MNNHRKRQLLWLLTTLTAVGAVAVLIAAFTLPYPPTLSDTPVNEHASPTTRQQTSPAMLTYSSATLRKVTTLDLRQPLYDPPPPPPAPEVKKPRPPLRLKLQATMVETDHSMAMITGSDGKTVFKTIGDVIDNAEIVEITDTQITVRYHEELVPLLIEKTPGSSNGGRGYSGGRRRR